LRNSLRAGPVASRGWRAILAVCAALALSFSGSARAAPPNGLSLSGPWFRFVMASLPAAGYFTLSNASDVPQTLVGAASPACGSLMLHRSVSANGTEKMIMVTSVAVPAHGKLQFAPGGYHLMCLSPTTAIRPGQSVPVTLRFKGGESLSATFPVRGPTGK
jgi:periplasmic copper chaperone A